MSISIEIDMVFCEGCQEYVPMKIDTGEVDSACSNALCPFGVYGEDDRTKELNFNDERGSRDDELYTSERDNDPEGC